MKHNGKNGNSLIPKSFPNQGYQVRNGDFSLPNWEKRPSEGEAAASLSHHITGYAWNSEKGEWFRYTGDHWEAGADEALHDTTYDLLMASVTQGVGFNFINNVTKLMRRHHKMMVNDNHQLLPFKNCVLNIETNDTFDHHPELGFTWCLPYEYDPQAECPTFLNWLDRATAGNKARKLILRSYMNAIIKGKAGLQVFVELVGKAGSGKSTFINLCTALIGKENTTSTELKQLEQNKFETANLYGKRLAVITDSGRYGGGVDTLKALVGQDIVRCERKNKQQGGGFRFGGMVLVAANEPIRSTDYTSGFARRRLQVEFNQRIKAKDRSLTIEDELIAEAPGILNWALRMTDEQVKETLHGVISEHAKKAALVDSNSLATWMNERLVFDSGNRLRIGTKDAIKYPPHEFAYANYYQWCEENGYSPINTHRFSRNVDDLASEVGFDVIKDKDKQGAFITNLRLRAEFDDMPFLISDENSLPDNMDIDENNSQLVTLGDDRVTLEKPVGDGFDGFDEVYCCAYRDKINHKENNDENRKTECSIADFSIGKNKSSQKPSKPSTTGVLTVTEPSPTVIETIKIDEKISKERKVIRESLDNTNPKDKRTGLDRNILIEEGEANGIEPHVMQEVLKDMEKKKEVIVFGGKYFKAWRKLHS